MKLATVGVVGSLPDSLSLKEKILQRRTHHSESNFHHRTKIGPMMLEGHHVDDLDGSVGSRVSTDEQTVDGLVGVFESMNDEFGVGEVAKAKYWA
jgi:hypothetical protein